MNVRKQTVRMVGHYISPDYNLPPGREVELPIKLAKSLIRARTAVEIKPKAKPEPKAPEPSNDPADGTAAEILERVAGDQQAAADALAAEQAKDRPRSTLVAELKKIVSA